MEHGGGGGATEDRGPERLMDDYLKGIGLHRKRIAKDGSCLFRAVAEQVLHSQSLHTKVRENCVEFLKQNKESYAAFIEGDFEEYLNKLKDPQQWVGEVEINALSAMYKRDFLIYQDPDKPAVNITSKNFKDTVQLCFLNGNHYDSVYPISHIKNTALCQSILYELLYDGVFRVDGSLQSLCNRSSRPFDQLSDDNMNVCASSDESDAEADQPLWVENGTSTTSTRHNNPSYRGRGRGRQLPERVRRSLNPTLLRNIEYDVWIKTKRAQQKLDYCIAAGLQFTAGDRCQVRVDGRSYNGTIKEVPPDNGLVTVYIEELGKKQVPLWNLSRPSEESSWSTVVREKRLNNGHGDWEERGRGRGRGKHAPPPSSNSSSSSSSSVAAVTAPGSNGRVQKQNSWPQQATVEEQGGSRATRKSSSVEFGLTEEERQAKAEEQMNVALVELQLRDEHSFPALGSQSGPQAEGGKKKGGDKRRSQRNKTKSPVEDVRSSSPSGGERPKSSTPPPPPPPSVNTTTTSTTATANSTTTDPPPAWLSSIKASIPNASVVTVTTTSSSSSSSSSFAAATKSSAPSPPPPKSSPSPQPLFSFLPPALPSASSSSPSPPPPTTSSSSPSPPTFITPIAPSPTTSSSSSSAPQGFLPSSPSPPLLPPPTSSSSTSTSSSSSVIHQAAPPAPTVQDPQTLVHPQATQTQTLTPAVPQSQPLMPQTQIQIQSGLYPPQTSVTHPQVQVYPQATQNQIQTQAPLTQSQSLMPQTQIQTSTPHPQTQYPSQSHSEVVQVQPPYPDTSSSSSAPPPPPPPQPPHPSQIPHPSLSLQTQTQTQAPQPQVVSGPPAPLPPQSIPGAVPLQQLSQLYQDPLYPGFPLTLKGDLAPVPPFSSSKSGDDLPTDVNVLRFFFNMGVKSYSMPVFPPCIYLLPLQQAYALQARPPSPSRSTSPTPTPPPPPPPPNPAPQYPPATRHQESYPLPHLQPHQYPPTSSSIPHQFEHQTPPADPHPHPHPPDPPFSQAPYPVIHPAPQHVPLPWQQPHVPPTRSFPVGYPAQSPAYPVPQSMPQGYHPPYPPYPPSSMGYQGTTTPEDLQGGQVSMEQRQPPSVDPGRAPGPLESPAHSRSAVPGFSHKKDQGTMLLVDPPINNTPILITNSDMKKLSAMKTSSSPGSPSPFDPDNPPSRCYWGNRKPQSLYASPPPPPPTEAAYLPLSVGCSTEDDWDEQQLGGSGFKPPTTTFHQRGPRRGRRGRGGHDPGRGGQRGAGGGGGGGRRYPGDQGAGLNYVQFSSTHRGRGRERGY